jgi:sulfopyruvate decarboxylase subunit alpha
MSVLQVSEVSVRAQSIIDHLITAEQEVFIGTPCGILGPLFQEIENRDANLIYAPREDTAVSVACGMAMRGKKSVVLMQNSGFAQSVNVLASLVIPFQIPVLMIISLRGYDIDNTPENLVMGRITCDLLEDLGIPYKIAQPDSYLADLEWARHCVEQEEQSAVLLIPPTFLGWSPCQ